MDRNRILKELRSIQNLPTLPSIAMAVNQMLKDYEAPIDRLVALLEKDQSMVMKILRLVNSSFFGFKNKVQSVRHAVTLLGYNTVQNAVIMVSVVDALTLKKELKGFDIGQFWQHAVRVAVMSKYMAAKTKLAPAEDAFTAGLLHDIGKVVLANFFPQVLLEIIETSAAEKKTFCGAENGLGLPSHSLVGSILAKQWMLPETMVQTIKSHHADQNNGGRDPIARLVNICDTIVHMMSGDPGYQFNMAAFDDEVCAAVTTFMQKQSQWFTEVKKEMSAACDFFKRG